MQATTRDGGDSRKALLPWPTIGLAVANTDGGAATTPSANSIRAAPGIDAAREALRIRRGSA